MLVLRQVSTLFVILDYVVLRGAVVNYHSVLGTRDDPWGKQL